MLVLRYWQRWTSQEATAATSSLPFGAARFRQWTSASVPGTPATSSLPFGPLRFRAWAPASISPPTDYFPDVAVPANGRPVRIRIPESIQRDDDEIVVFLANLLHAGIL